MSYVIQFKAITPQHLSSQRLLIPDTELKQLGQYVDQQLQSTKLSLTKSQSALFDQKTLTGTITKAMVQKWLKLLNHIKLPVDNERLRQNLAEFALLLRNAYDHDQVLLWEAGGQNG